MQARVMSQLKSKVRKQNSLFTGDSNLLNPSTAWMRPTHIMVGNLLCFKSTHLNVNLAEPYGGPWGLGAGGARCWRPPRHPPPPPPPRTHIGSQPQAGGLGLWGGTRSAVGCCGMSAVRGSEKASGSQLCIGHRSVPPGPPGRARPVARGELRAGAGTAAPVRRSLPDPPPLPPRVTEPLPLSLALPGASVSFPGWFSAKA